MNIDFSLAYETMDKKLMKFKRIMINEFVERKANEKRKEIDDAQLAPEEYLKQIRSIKEEKYNTTEYLNKFNPRIDFETLKVQDDGYNLRLAMKHTVTTKL